MTPDLHDHSVYVYIVQCNKLNGIINYNIMIIPLYLHGSEVIAFVYIFYMGSLKYVLLNNNMYVYNYINLLQRSGHTIYCTKIR